MTPSINIGIMTRNYGCFLDQAIQSVLSQSRADWEIIISDDASSDNTPDIVQPYLNDPRIRYIRHEHNLGQADNWGFLLSQGQAPVVAVLHADDHWLPGALDIALTAFEDNAELDLLYGNWQRMVNGVLEPRPYIQEPAHTMTGQEEYRFQVGRYSWLPSATFLSRRVVERAGRPNPALQMYVDTDYLLRVARHSRRTRALAEPLMVYRVHQSNATSAGTNNDRLHKEKEMLPAICEAALEDCPALRPQINIMRRDMAQRIFAAGVSEAIQGRLQSGRSLMKRARRMDARIIWEPKVVADYLMASCGPPLLPMMRRLHPGRAPWEVPVEVS